MIALNRNYNPISFPSAFTGQTRIAWELDLLEQAREIAKGTKEKYSFSTSRWKTAKDNLKLESYNKCAYCEVNFSAVAYGDVEHYRPKSKYWWLAYCYFNYSVSCQLCNQKYKRAKFPVPKRPLKAPRIRKNNTDAYLRKKAGFLTPNPCLLYTSPSPRDS